MESILVIAQRLTCVTLSCKGQRKKKKWADIVDVEVVTHWGYAEKAQQTDVLRNVAEQTVAFLKRHSFLLTKAELLWRNGSLLRSEPEAIRSDLWVPGASLPTVPKVCGKPWCRELASAFRVMN
jgi:hypothetical protein